MSLNDLKVVLQKLVLFSCTALFCHSSLAIDVGVAKTNLSQNLKYKDSWSFSLAPYVWFAGLSGHANLKGKRVTFTSAYSELRHDLDMSIGVHFEAGLGPWSLLFDPDYVKITQANSSSGINTKTTYETTITDGGVYYRFLSYLTPKQPEPLASLELLGGGRAVTFHTSIQFLDNSTFPSSDTSGVFVPLVGARIKYNFTPKLHSWLSGDFGGFQVDHVSSTWSLMAGLSYQLKEQFALSLGYKALGINYSKKVITINTILQGPVLACVFSW